MIREAINKAVAGKDLSRQEMVAVMNQIMEGRATQAQIGAFLAALRIKGECVAEIAGAAQVMREKAAPVPTQAGASGRVLLDIVGTGGDGAGTFNVSTTAAFVAAGAGVAVAKHGNRAVSSKSGAADLIESLGAPLDLSPEQMGRVIDQAGIGFLFAPVLHPAMAHAIGPRREIGMRTVFNLLGPLTNPAGATHLLLGVYGPELVEPMARVLSELGCRGGMVVHGAGGLDEVSLAGPTRFCRLLPGGEIEDGQLTPQEAGLAPCRPEDLAAKDPAASKAMALGVLRGEKGAPRDMVLINAGAGLLAAGAAENLANGVALAAASIDNGRALERLEAMVASARSLAPARAEAC